MCPAGSSTRSCEAAPVPLRPPTIAHLHTPLRQLRRSEAVRPLLRRLRRSGSGNETSSRSCLTLTKGFHAILFILKRSGAAIESGENTITGKQLTVGVLTSAQGIGSGRSARPEGSVALEGVGLGSSPSQGNCLFNLYSRSILTPLSLSKCKRIFMYFRNV